MWTVVIVYLGKFINAPLLLKEVEAGGLGPETGPTGLQMLNSYIGSYFLPSDPLLSGAPYEIPRERSQ